MFKPSRSLKGIAVILAALALTAVPVFSAEKTPSEPDGLEDESGDVIQAIQGYDPVAYFREGRPVKGKKDYSYDRGGERWSFASEDNRLRFIEYPEKFLPRYGGYSALDVAEGKKIQADPKIWSVSEGRLYLHKNLASLAEWEKKQEENIDRSDYQWPRIR
ncbi:MAG: YHS domain-containing protein [Candidatus Omnitrophica bacterium]|nr:YHS domain-containing protein [Candidatus Omnitrophota bacterium]